MNLSLKSPRICCLCPLLSCLFVCPLSRSLSLSLSPSLPVRRVLVSEPTSGAELDVLPSNGALSHPSNSSEFVKPSLIMAPVITPFFAPRHSTFFSRPFMHSVSLNHLRARRLRLITWPMEAAVGPCRRRRTADSAGIPRHGGGQQWAERRRHRLPPSAYPLVGRDGGTARDSLAPRPVPSRPAAAAAAATSLALLSCTNWKCFE